MCGRGGALRVWRGGRGRRRGQEHCEWDGGDGNPVAAVDLVLVVVVVAVVAAAAAAAAACCLPSHCCFCCSWLWLSCAGPDDYRATAAARCGCSSLQQGLLCKSVCTCVYACASGNLSTISWKGRAVRYTHQQRLLPLLI